MSYAYPAGEGLATILSRLGPDGLLGQMLRWGPHGARIGGDGMSLRKLKNAPHGIDLGPLQPCLPERLGTPNQRITLVPKVLADDLPRLQRVLDEEHDGERLVLIGRRQLRTNNSWLHNSQRMVKGPERCTLLMHPDDAARLGLEQGGRVVVESRVGSLEAPLQLSDEMMPGVVSLPHGFGHRPTGMKLSVATLRPGVRTAAEGANPGGIRL